jgi:hypothetical protein
MNLVYKWCYIEYDADSSKAKWCITPVLHYIDSLKHGTSCDWDMFDSLSDAKVYIDIQYQNYN